MIIISASSLAVAGSLALASCASSPSPRAADTTATVTSCGIDLTVPTAPERAIALEQGATEVMLALGLEDRMIGTSYLTDTVSPEFADAYAAVPVLADQYPTSERLREAEPDFVYSMRSSAFSPDAAGARQELVDLGVPAYLSSNDCEDPSRIASDVGFEQIADEVKDIATVFDVADRGDQIVADQEAALADVEDSSTSVGSPSVVWLYSSIDGSPVVAGANGLAQTMGEIAGATNAFADLDAQWGETSWDEIAQRDPDVIVVADLSRGLSGDSAADKISSLKSDAVTSGLAAVRADRIVAIPATELDPSVRSIHALQTLSTSLVAFSGVGR